jgi:hypothetical protein
MEWNAMPRNTLKSFPTAALRRGMANFHPSSRPSAQPPAAGDDPRDGGGRRVPEPPAPIVIAPRIDEAEPLPAWS